METIFGTENATVGPRYHNVFILESETVLSKFGLTSERGEMGQKIRKTVRNVFVTQDLIL